jgi:hypothetical protein
MEWKTAKDNDIELRFPAGGVDSLRIVWQQGGSDVCYVVPCDGNNGNSNAKLIAAAPELWSACVLLIAAIDNCQDSVPAAVLEAATKCRCAASKAI